MRAGGAFAHLRCAGAGVYATGGVLSGRTALVAPISFLGMTSCLTATSLPFQMPMYTSP